MTLVTADGTPIKQGAPRVMMVHADGTYSAVDFSTFALELTALMGRLAHGILHTPEEGTHAERKEGELVTDEGNVAH